MQLEAGHLRVPSRMWSMLLLVILSLTSCNAVSDMQTPKSSEADADRPDATSTQKAEPGSSSTPDSEFTTQSATTADGHHNVQFSLPQPIPLNREFTLNGHVDGATRLRVSATMPQHEHGLVRNPQVTLAADGSFTVDGLLFHMPGRWELIFDVEHDFRSERAQLSLMVK